MNLEETLQNEVEELKDEINRLEKEVVLYQERIKVLEGGISDIFDTIKELL